MRTSYGIRTIDCPNGFWSLTGTLPNTCMTFFRIPVEKLDIGLVENVAKRRGRPRKYQSNPERVAQQRQKAREQKIKIWAEQLRPNSQDTSGEDDCRKRGLKMRGVPCRKGYKTILYYFWHRTPGLPSSGPFHPQSHSPMYPAKRMLSLISSAGVMNGGQIPRRTTIFSAQPSLIPPFGGTNRGKANIAYLRHVVLDFENGELRPEELPILFPGLRITITNTFNHTADKPQFRAVFPTSEIMTPEVYCLIQGCLGDKLEDAGYGVDRGGKGRKGQDY